MFFVTGVDSGHILVIQSNLKWNEHIDLIISKASKRLHILRDVRRDGVPPKDLLLRYFALIRSVLEYCCVVWHHAIPLYLSEEVERVQKRAFRIILPSVHYKDALRTLDCLTLAERQANICLRTVKNIYKEGGCLSRHLPLDKTHSYNTRNCMSFSKFSTIH